MNSKIIALNIASISHYDTRYKYKYCKPSHTCMDINGYGELKKYGYIY
jgi:hypothetical protein